jgi:hypothetical protein
MPKIKNVKSKNLSPVLHIYCEGEKTEPIYLKKYIEQKHPGNRKLKVIKIEDTNKNTPTQLVKEAVNNKNNCPKNDSFWVVYDREAVNKYPDSLHQQAVTEANSNGIKIALSNVCFEIWLLLHFENGGKPYSNYDDLLKTSSLKKHLKNLGVSKYDKANHNIFDLLSDRIDDARNRAVAMNKATQKSAPNNCTEPHLLNPYCDVHKLLDAIDQF